MRFSGPLILKITTPRTGYLMFTLISAILAVTAILVENVTLMMVLLALSGFMQGSNVAFLVLMCTATFPERIASASSLPFIAASLAAMTAPLCMGAMADHTGFSFPLIIGCALLALSVVPIILIKR